MEHRIVIQLYSTDVGEVSFLETPDQLVMGRTAAGFEMQIPFELRLHPLPPGHPFTSQRYAVMMKNLHGSVWANCPSPASIKLGDLECDQWFTSSSDGYLARSSLTWSAPLGALILYEKLRNGNPPHLRMRLAGELSCLLPHSAGSFRLPAEPIPFAGEADVRYALETWTKALREVRAAQNVLVEVPLPGTAAPEWEAVWDALRDAIVAFEQGGATAWRSCVSSVRLALENWQNAEPEDHGPGWNAPPRQERESRSKQQRLDNLRWDLLQCAHYWVHTPAEDCSRHDAVLILAAFAALLAERKP